MVDLGTSTTNNGFKTTFRASAATIAAIASILSILIFLGGFIAGALTLRENVNRLQTDLAEIKTRLDLMVGRLTKLEDKVDYTAQGVADLKALTAGTKR